MIVFLAEKDVLGFAADSSRMADLSFGVNVIGI
jgi:hypothetical protein